MSRLLIGWSFTVCPHIIKMALVNHLQQKSRKEGGGFVLARSIISAQSLWRLLVVKLHHFFVVDSRWSKLPDRQADQQAGYLSRCLWFRPFLSQRLGLFLSSLQQIGAVLVGAVAKLIDKSIINRTWWLPLVVMTLDRFSKFRLFNPLYSHDKNSDSADSISSASY